MKTYYNEYAHTNHAKWLSETFHIVPSALGELVANILGYVGGGLYNCPIDLRKVDWTRQTFIEVVWSGDLTNWDDSSLSRLWVLCHRNMVRIQIGATVTESFERNDYGGEPIVSHTPELLLGFHKRETREGSLMDRLPDCEDMIKDIDDDFERVK